MVEILKAYPEDFNSLYPVLKELDNAIPKETWEQLFIRNWDSPEDFVGLKLMVDNKIAGFLGLIFSKRNINENNVTICNWSALIAFKEYRDGITPKKLIYEALEIKDCIIVGLTPTEKLYNIYMSLGFSRLDGNIRMFCKQKFKSKKYNENIFYNNDIVQYLNETDRIIYEDHKKFNCSHILIKTENNYIYMVLKKCMYSYNKLFLPKITFYFNAILNKIFRFSYLSKQKMYGKVHYCSNYKSLCENINKYKKTICDKIGINGLIIDERFLKNRKIQHSIKGSWQKSVYKSNLKTPILPTDIDSLYSELFLLDL